MSKPDRRPVVHTKVPSVVVNATSLAPVPVGLQPPRTRLVQVSGAHLPLDALLYVLTLLWCLVALSDLEQCAFLLALCLRSRGTGFTWWRITAR